MLNLLLLNLQTTDDLLQLVHRSATFAELVGEILDLLGERFVLASGSLQSFAQLILDSFGLEEIGGQVAGITLGGIKLSRQVIALLAPFVNDLVEALLLLLQSAGVGCGTL